MSIVKIPDGYGGEFVLGVQDGFIKLNGGMPDYFVGNHYNGRCGGGVRVFRLNNGEIRVFCSRCGIGLFLPAACISATGIEEYLAQQEQKRQESIRQR